MTQNNQKETAAWRILPLGILAAILSTEWWLEVGFSLVPLSCVISLFVFASFMNFSRIVKWAVIYMATTIIVLWSHYGRWADAKGNAQGMLFTRSLGTLAVGSMACALAKLRTREKIYRQDLRMLLQQISVPAIMSDANGWILQMNEAARASLGIEGVAGKPFFNYFKAVSEKGKTIQLYLDLVSGELAGPLTIELCSEKDRSRVFSAMMMKFQYGNAAHVLTLISLLAGDGEEAS